MNHKKQAIQTLTYYLRSVSESWDYDNDSEVESIVDNIVNAAAAEMKTELDQLRTQIQQLRDDIRAIGSHPSLI